MAEKRVSLIVKKSNTLCRASWAPKSVWEARLVALIASKIHTEDEDFQTYEVPIEEVITDSHSRGKESYILIDKATDHAMDHKIKLKNKRGGWDKYNFFSKCSLDLTNNTITVRFDPDLKNHFIELKSNFTTYELTQFLLLPSTYSQRIFEITRSWKDQPEVEIPLPELHIMLNVPPSLKSDYKNFKRLVLVKSYNDIHKHTDLKYEWEPVKKGRKVVAIRFIFAAKRVQKAVVKQITEKQKRKSQSNNKYGKLAINCFSEHKKAASMCENDNKPQACELCKEMFPTLINHALI